MKPKVNWSKKGAKWIERQLVWSPIFIGICTNEGQFMRECQRLVDKGATFNPPQWVTDGADATCHYLTHPSGGEICLVCIRPRGKRSRAEWAALIVHEATHVWQNVRRSIGESRPSSEFEAYSLQSICQNLFEAVGL